LALCKTVKKLSTLDERAPSGPQTANGADLCDKNAEKHPGKTAALRPFELPALLIRPLHLLLY
jgi:hypothetical protein